ncbi:MAG TPA: MBL fold metallo-hydrolase [Nocardioidaceae bacterium]|nr:MBL fold metallo-hydrolase [Nocardioidaceae bacterium]
MKLTIIGMSGSYPGPDSPASCYLVEQEHAGGVYRLLLDLGNGALGPLQRHVDLDKVDAVLLSHLHADHCIDLCGYYVVRKYALDAPWPRIPVYGPAGTADRMARAYDLPLDPGMHEEFDFRAFPTGTFSLGPFQIRTTMVEHPVPAYAMRLEAGGRSLVYSGDTGECRALVELADRADLFLCEASSVEGIELPPGLHLTGKQAGEHATSADVGRMVLTHIPPAIDTKQVFREAEETYTGELEVARPGAMYSL